MITGFIVFLAFFARNGAGFPPHRDSRHSFGVEKLRRGGGRQGAGGSRSQGYEGTENTRRNGSDFRHLCGASWRGVCCRGKRKSFPPMV